MIMKKLFTLSILSAIVIIVFQIIAPTSSVTVNSIENSYPEDQKYMNNLISETLNEIDNLNDAAKKKVWIGKSNKLCSSSLFNVQSEKKDWIGILRSVDMNDAGTKITIAIDINNSNTVYGVEKSNLISESLLFSLNKSDTIQFTGYFEEGKKSENQCLDKASIIGDNNPFLYNQTFKFNFKKIEKLPEKLSYTNDALQDESSGTLIIIVIIGIIIFRKDIKRIFWFSKK